MVQKTQRLNKFRGILEFEVGDEKIVLRDFSVNDLFDLIKLSKSKECELLDGVIFFINILHKSYPKEFLGDIEAFIVTNYNDFVNSLVVSLGWTTNKKLNDHNKLKSIEKKTGKKSLALFKARMAAEADADTVEDRYITAAYAIMRKFKYSIETLLEMPSTTFNILLEELEKQNKREIAESKKGRKR